MFRSLLRKPFRLSVAETTLNNFLCLRHHESCTKTQFPTSTSSSHSDSTISFFRTSCGLSPSVALTAAARTNLKTTANAKLVLGLLKIYGFTKSQITIIATKLPALFSYHPEKCIKAKIELFLSAGFTGTAIAKLISKDPSIIKSSLERKLRPNLHLLMTVHSGDRESAATSIAGSTWLLSLNPEKQILPNMKTLQKHGVPDANIARLFKWCPRVITQEPSRFSKSVALLEEMGFKQSTSSFVIGIKVVAGLDVATWERKLQLYHSLGWSQEEVISAFKKNPFCMLLSEDKIRKVMGFFVEKLKWEPCRLASLPIVLSYSLEKRIVPSNVWIGRHALSSSADMRFLCIFTIWIQCRDLQVVDQTKREGTTCGTQGLRGQTAVVVDQERLGSFSCYLVVIYFLLFWLCTVRARGPNLCIWLVRTL